MSKLLRKIRSQKWTSCYKEGAAELKRLERQKRLIKRLLQGCGFNDCGSEVCAAMREARDKILKGKL